jgi:hypothetical protein
MTITETPAAQLRAAAKLMRERAEAASDGPWFSWIEGRDGHGEESFVGTPRADLYVSVGMHGEGAHERWQADQDYIATMHPIVGAALADWLEATATDADDLIKQDTPDCGHEDDTLGCHCERGPVWGCDRCGEYIAPGACHCWDKALAVARAYLGETP